MCFKVSTLHGTGKPLLQPYTSNIKTADFDVVLHILVMNMFYQGSDGSLMIISAKANVHWSPLQDEQIWRWQVVIVLEQLRVFKTNNANTVGICLCQNSKQHQMNPHSLRLKQIVVYLLPIYMFRFPSHHVFTWQATTWKKNPLQVSSLSFQVPLSSDGGIVCDHITLDAPAKQTTNSLPDQHIMPCSEFCQPKICHVDVGSVCLELFED